MRGFAFDPLAGEEARELGQLTILQVRMNPDLGARLRSLDAIHIASALRLGADLEAFITYDARQTEAAKEFWFNVEAPGQK